MINTILKKALLPMVSAVLLMGFALTALAADTIEYDGLIEPFAVVDIGAPAEGIVDQVSVDRSDTIEQGQTLVKLESSVEQVNLEKARSQITFDGDIKFQKTQLAFAQRVHNRVKTLSAISSHDKDQAATDILLTRYRIKKAHENQILANFELKKAKAIMGRKIIKSPISGVVVDRYVSPGEYVNSQPLLRVAQVDPLKVEVIIPAQMFGRIHAGMTATIVPELSEYEAETATVSIVDKVIDAASNTFGVRLMLPNPQLKLPGGLKCKVQFNTGEMEAATKSARAARAAAVAQGDIQAAESVPADESTELAPVIQTAQAIKEIETAESQKIKKIRRKNMIPKTRPIILVSSDEG